jgi:hypothetical protein
MTGRDPLEPSEDIGTPANPGGPGSTEFDIPEPIGPEPKEDDIYIPLDDRPPSQN